MICYACFGSREQQSMLAKAYACTCLGPEPPLPCRSHPFVFLSAYRITGPGHRPMRGHMGMKYNMGISARATACHSTSSHPLHLAEPRPAGPHGMSKRLATNFFHHPYVCHAPQWPMLDGPWFPHASSLFARSLGPQPQHSQAPWPSASRSLFPDPHLLLEQHLGSPTKGQSWPTREAPRFVPPPPPLPQLPQPLLQLPAARPPAAAAAQTARTGREEEACRRHASGSHPSMQAQGTHLCQQPGSGILCPAASSGPPSRPSPLRCAASAGAAPAAARPTRAASKS